MGPLLCDQTRVQLGVQPLQENNEMRFESHGVSDGGRLQRGGFSKQVSRDGLQRHILLLFSLNYYSFIKLTDKMTYIILFTIT